MNGDLFTLDYIRDRIRPTERLNQGLEALHASVSDGHLDAAAAAAARLRKMIAG